MEKSHTGRLFSVFSAKMAGATAFIYVLYEQQSNVEVLVVAMSEHFGPEQTLRRLIEAVGEEGREEVMTAADELRAEGRDEGRKEGLEQGQRKTLLRQLGIRFGTLPDSVVTQVHSASPALLDEWTDRVLTAPSLAEALGES